MTENTIPAADATVETGTDLAVRSDPRAIIAGLNKGDLGVFSTVKAETQADKIRVLQALTDPLSVDENLGTVFNLNNFIVQAVEIRDEKSGTVTTAPRVILIADDDTAYAAVSTGLLRSLENLIGIVGHPETWEGPIAVSVVEQKSRNNYKFFTLKYA